MSQSLSQVIVCPNCEAELSLLDEPDEVIESYMREAKHGDRFFCGACAIPTIELTADGVKPASPPWDRPKQRYFFQGRWITVDKEATGLIACRKVPDQS